jgi:hypothetical protein
MPQIDIRRLAVLTVLAGLGCGDHTASKQVQGTPPALTDDGSGGHAAAAQGRGGDPKGTTGAGAGEVTGTGGSTAIGTGGSPASPADMFPADRFTDICGPCEGESPDALSFECYCALTGCKDKHPSQLPSFNCEHAYKFGELDGFDPTLSYVAHGCGLVAISISHSTGGTTLVYRESDHELVGGGYGIDCCGVAKICGKVTGFYQTANADLSQCPDYTICSPCAPGGLHSLCSEAELPDADGGT